jgi:hypothetical protein
MRPISARALQPNNSGRIPKRKIQEEKPNKNDPNLAHFYVRAVSGRQSLFARGAQPPAVVRCQHDRAIRPFVAHLAVDAAVFSGARKRPSSPPSGLTRALNSARSDMSPIPAVGSCGQTCSNNQARGRCLLFRTRFASRDRRKSRRRCTFRMTSSCRNCSCFSASAISALPPLLSTEHGLCARAHSYRSNVFPPGRSGFALMLDLAETRADAKSS